MRTEGRQGTFIPVFLAVFCLFCGALFIRFVYVDRAEILNHSDATQYMLYGYNLYYRNTFSKEFLDPQPDSYRSPGYPLLLALAFAMGGGQRFENVAVALQTFLSALLVPLCYLLGRRFLAVGPALGASLLVALSPHLVTMSGYILTEILFCFLLLLALLLYHLALEREGRLLFAGAGLVFGLAYLTNETCLLLPLLLAVYAAVRRTRSSGSVRGKILVRNSVLFIVVFLLFPAGWALRNTMNLSPQADRGGARALATITHGTYPGFVYKDPAYRYYPYKEDPAQPAYSASLSGFWEVFRERFRERPLRYISWYLFEKPYYFWSWTLLQGVGPIYVYATTGSIFESVALFQGIVLFMRLLHPVLVVCMLGGLVLKGCRERLFSLGQPLPNNPAPLYLTACYFTAIYMVFAPWPRYSIPLRPELYLLAIWVVCEVWGDWRRRRVRLMGNEALLKQPDLS